MVSLEKALLEIHRKALEDLQQGGSNTLFVTIGTLHWVEEGREKRYRAPLLLVPVILERPSVRSGFRLRPHDDEPCINWSLIEKLRQDFAMRFPALEGDALPVDATGVDPDAPGAYLAGVECDGATYHRGATARDRDRLRQLVLENLGWNIQRVWSTDWWTNAGRETERLHGTLQTLLSDARASRSSTNSPEVDLSAFEGASEIGRGSTTDSESDALSEMPGDDFRDAVGQNQDYPFQPETRERLYARLPPAADVPVRPDPAGVQATNGLSHLRETMPIEGFVLPDLSLQAERFYDASYAAILRDLALRLLAGNGPMREDRLAQAIANAYGFQRTGNRIREAVAAALGRRVTWTTESVGRFAWPPGVVPDTWNPPVAPMETACDPAELPLRQLVAIARICRRADEGATLTTMRDHLGMKRMGGPSKARFLEAIAEFQRLG